MTPVSGLNAGYRSAGGLHQPSDEALVRPIADQELPVFYSSLGSIPVSEIVLGVAR